MCVEKEEYWGDKGTLLHGHEKTLSLVVNRCPYDYDTQIYETTIANSKGKSRKKNNFCPFACECLKQYIIISLLVKYRELVLKVELQYKCIINDLATFCTSYGI